MDAATRASQLGATPIPDADVFITPLFEEEFVSEQFPYMNGTVKLRFPNFGEEVEMARISSSDGQTMVAVVRASFMVCIETAPAAWWRKIPNVDKPILALDALHDAAGLVGLYTRWMLWRNSFRQEVPGEPARG